MFPAARLLPALLALCGLLAAPPLFADLSDRKKELAHAIHAQDLGRIAELFGQLGTSNDPEAAELILKTLQAVPPEDIAEAAIQALLRLGLDRIAPAFEEALDSKRPDPTAVATIFEVAEQLSDERSEDWLLAGLDMRDELIVRNAIQALRERRSKRVIPRLIDIIEEIPGDASIISYSAHMALIDLTGQDFESIEDWRAFWELHGPTLDPSDLEVAEGSTGVARRKPDDKSPTFFGVEIVSRKVMFVIDCSGSMEMYDESQEEGGGGGADWRVRQRIYRARNQLGEVIAKLPRNARFNIISYNDKLKIFNPDGIVPANGKWKRRALDFVDGLRAGATTHTDAALERAFEDHAIDSIILLSDGAPYHGEGMGGNQLIPMILEQVKKLNRLRKLKIFTFGFEGLGRYPPGHQLENQPPSPSEAMVAFLRELADEHGGRYTSIR